MKLVNNKKLILHRYNKKNFLPVYSGTLAIEGILKSLKLDKNDKVLITNVVCYSILHAILNANLTPIIVVPKNGLTLSKKEIKDVVENEKVKVFIAVHQYGYEQEIERIKDLIIIEDISQAWNIKLNNSYVGAHRDYIITSLVDFINEFDIKTKECRNSFDSILEYYYPISINYKKLVKKADKKVIKQRQNAKFFKKIFQKYNFINGIEEKNTIPSYHRFPIFVNDTEYDNIISILEKCNINFQKEYKKKLDEINVVKKKGIKVIGNNKIKKCLLLRTTNNYLNLKIFEFEMRNYYGS